ncbi:uncharacterized protein involved in exopolysaccharide biosynthesis [Sinobacterium caligoides]|uniref:Uncharacterized protein involved in exopolysaccharide biosynthesis n=1 Tax=Sinobacterium caligoides TaxID=933926 RepID=A0A3N2E1Z8_9GAMM|nr:Wzz/FepE/Etk N-terminal domain-containing protein [Sinobacterium caligoides]ROS06131.1 uncharacterized protein involved in exopolysaccharide biosynthesis [Sinobacterium caligoides]
MSSYYEQEEQGKSGMDYVRLIKRHKKPSMIVASIVFIISLLVALFWPPTYRSTATILIEEQDIPTDMVRSTVTTFADKQIQEITQRAMTLTNIMDLVSKYELVSKKDLDRTPRSEIALDFKEDTKIDVISANVVDPISGRPTEATIAFTISYEHNNPKKAQKVTNDLVSIYLRENIKQRSEQAKNAREFLDKEGGTLEDELAGYEKEMADFKQQNKDSLPELFNYNMQVSDRLERELLDLNSYIAQLQSELLDIESRVSTVSPYAPTILADGRAAMGDVDRLKALQSEFREKSARYKEDHPDLVRLKSEINRLAAVVGSTLKPDDLKKLILQNQSELNALKVKFTDEHPAVIDKRNLIKSMKSQQGNARVSEVNVASADNPLYVQLLTKKNSLTLEIRSSKEKLVSLEEQLKAVNVAIAKSPDVEVKYQDLSRHYQEVSMKYAEIKMKQRTAGLAVQLEQELRSERFTLIEPPTEPQAPTSPNRIVIVILGLLLSAGVGLAVALLKDALDQSIRGNNAVMGVTGVMPLVTIQYIKNPEEMMRSEPNRKLLIVFGGLILLVITSMALIHFFYKPLDVMWFIALRKLGI